MKKFKKSFSGIQNHKFDDKEYNMLRQEQCLRLEMTHNHGFTLISIVLVYFSAIFVFLGEIFKLATTTDSVLGQYIIVDSLIILSFVIFCALPVFLIFCLSSKYEDNIRQICSVGAYMRVFYEYPSMKKCKDTANNDGLLGWELLHCNSAVPKANFISKEYIVLSAASILLTLCIGSGLFATAFIANKHYYEDNMVGSIIDICIFLLLFIAILIVLIIVAIKSFKNTNTKEIMQNYKDKYLDEYCTRALEIGLLNEAETNEMKAVTAHMRKRDTDLVTKMDKRNKECKNVDIDIKSNGKKIITIKI